MAFIRKTEVLLYGRTVGMMEAWNEGADVMRNQLFNDWGAWHYIANPCTSLGDALKYIEQRKELQIVAIYNELDWPRESLLTDCTQIALALAGHKQKPWVALGHIGLDYLIPIFEAAGVVVAHDYYNSAVIFDRFELHQKEVHQVERKQMLFSADHQYWCHTCQHDLVRPSSMGDDEWNDLVYLFFSRHPDPNNEMLVYEQKAQEVTPAAAQ